MELVNLRSMLEPARKGHYAVGAFNYCNAETAQAVVEAGVALRSPVMFIIGPWELDLVGVPMVADIARWMAAGADVPVCLHLDHATEIDMVRACIEAGFPSVMIDASQHDFEENVRITKTVVDMAHPRGVTVEGELGAIGRADDSSVEGGHGQTLTDPSQAAEFVERTGVDALAIAIGNAHGIYKQQPTLDLTRLGDIAQAIDVPLVLHGGSGTPVDQLHKAIDIGICKVNVASEIGRAYLKAIEEGVAKRGGNAWYSQVLMEAKAAARGVVSRWMNELGCAGKAKGG